MDIQAFELLLKKFLDKAGVKVLKSGEDYESGENLPSYILLDEKRKSYYITETNKNFDSNINLEQVATASYIEEKNGLDKYTSQAILQLSSDIENSESIKIESIDLKDFTKKTALIIANNDSINLVKLLESNDIKFQKAQSNGDFTIIFIDKDYSEKIVNYANNISKEYLSSLNTENNNEAESLDETLPNEELNIDPIKEDIGIEGNLDSEALIDEPVELEQDSTLQNMPIEEEISSNDDNKESDNTYFDDSLLDNIDLSFIQPSKNEEEINEEDENTLYIKILENQIKNAKMVSSPVKRIVNNNLSENASKEQDDNQDNNDILPKDSNKSISDKSKKIKVSFTNKVYMLFANLSGLVLFLPAYILNKLLGRYLPAFIIYWLAGITAFFGVYQIGYSYVSPYIYNPMIGFINNVFPEIDNTLNSFKSLKDNNSLELVESKKMVVKSSMSLSTQVWILDKIQTGWILTYLMSLGWLLCIFPFSRKMGQNIVIFSTLFYFIAPLIVAVEGRIILLLSEFYLSSIEGQSLVKDDNINILGVGMFFATWIMPIFSILILYLISKILLPNNQKYTEVLP